MFNDGYVTFYNHTYAHNTTYNELKRIKYFCNDDTIICVGGGAIKNQDILTLVSCGNCNDILTNTSINSTVLVNGAYWYMKSNYSFGFSPNQNILQYYADSYDCLLNNNNKYICNDNKRLSWHLTEISGGWRIGSISGLNSSPDYRKYIFLKDFNRRNRSITTRSKTTNLPTSTGVQTTLVPQGKYLIIILK